MYDFAVEDCLYHLTCKNVSIGILEYIENQKIKCGSRGGTGGPDPPGKSQVIWVVRAFFVRLTWTPLAKIPGSAHGRCFAPQIRSQENCF